jgi:starch phosphorylase
MCLADFESYVNSYRCALKDYADREKWSRMSLVNTAASGVFASDNSIKKYADEIWHASPINKIKI